jgi:hypothetical protein
MVRPLLWRGNCEQLRMSVLHSIIPVIHSIAMLDPKFLEDLSAQISARISAALAAVPAADLEKNLRAMLTSAFARLDLVTREDFEVQGSLARAYPGWRRWRHDWSRGAAQSPVAPPCRPPSTDYLPKCPSLSCKAVRWPASPPRKSPSRCIWPTDCHLSLWLACLKPK